MTLNKPPCLWSFIFVLVAARVEKDHLYISNSTDILMVDIETGEHFSVYKTTGRIVALACDSELSLIFWSNYGDGLKGIYQSSVARNGSLYDVKPLDLFDVTEVPNFAVDTQNTNLFLINGERRSIEVYNYMNNAHRVLMIWELSHPESLALDMENMWLYWNDQDTRKIERSKFDGSRREVVIENVDANSIVFAKDSVLLFVNPKRKELMQFNIITRTITVCADLSIFHHALGLTYSDNQVFISLSYVGNILSVDIYNKNRKIFIASGLGNNYMLNIVLFQHKEKIIPDTSFTPCSGGILLAISKIESICTCPSYGAKIPYRQTTRTRKGIICTAGKATKILLFTSADEGIIGYKVLEPKFPEGSGLPFFLVGRSTRPAAVAYNPYTQEVFWSDVQEYCIHRAMLDGSQHSIVISTEESLGVVDGLAVDYGSGNIYYTNIGSLQVEGKEYSWNKIEIGFGSRRTVVENADKPRALAVLHNGILLFTNWGKQASVTAMDIGGEWKFVITSGLDNPNGIYVSNFYNPEEIFIVDSHYKTRKKENGHYLEEKDGKLHIYVSTGMISSNKLGNSFIEADVALDNVQLKLPFGITGEETSDGHDIYISDWYYKHIIKVTVRGITDMAYRGSDMELILEGIPTPMGVLLTPVSVLGEAKTCSLCKEVCPDYKYMGLCAKRICLNKWLEVPPPHQEPFNYICACHSYGLKVMSPRKRCETPDNFLLFADMTGIRLALLSGTEDNVHTVHTGLLYYSNYMAVTYDLKIQAMYFCDINSRTIYQKSLVDGAMKKICMNVISKGMTMGGEFLYWTNFLDGTIQSLRRSADQIQLVANGLDKPEAICDMNQMLFWTEVGVRTRVAMKSTVYDATEISSDFWTKGLVLPSTLFCDIFSSKLYIGDAVTHKIYICAVGTSPFCEPLRGLTSKPRHIYGLWVLQNKYLYYSDWEESTVVSMVLGTGVSKVIAKGVRPSQIYIYLSSPGKRLFCEEMGVKCKTKCVASPSGEKCTCDAGMIPRGDLGFCEKTDLSWVSSDPHTCEATCSDQQQCMRQASSPEYQCMCKKGKGRRKNGCPDCVRNFYKERPDGEDCEQCPDGAFTTPGSDTCSCYSPLAWDGIKKRCIDSRDEKVGTCPVRFVSFNLICDNHKQCQADNECPRAQKCCPLKNCGMRCLDPISDEFCVYNGKIYLPSEVFHPDDCTTCQCKTDKADLIFPDPRFGGASCKVTDCPNFHCDEDLVFVSGVCCPFCNHSSLFETNITNCPENPIILDLPPNIDYVFHNWKANVSYNPELKHLLKVDKTPPLSMFHWTGNNNLPHVVNVVSVLTLSGRQYDSAACSFEVFVRDVTPPIIECQPEVTMVVNSINKDLKIQPPQAYDNVGIVYPIISNLSSIVYPGTFLVSYLAKDEAGNEGTCTQRVTVKTFAFQSCTSFPEIFNGIMECQQLPTATGDICSIQCAEGYAYLDDKLILPYTNMVCQNNKWTPQFQIAEIRSLSCLANNKLKAIGKLIMTYHDCSLHISLDISTKYIQAQIETFIKSMNIKTHIQFKTKGSGCLTTDSDNEALDQNHGVSFVMFLYQTQQSEDVNGSAKDLNDVIMRLQRELEQGWLKLEVFTKDLNSKVMETSYLSVFIEEAKVNSCFQGEVVRTYGCLVCPRGTYHNGEKCELCKKNTYQDMEGQLQCIPCGGNNISQPGSFLLSQCKLPMQEGISIALLTVIVTSLLLLVIFFMASIVLRYVMERKNEMKATSEKQLSAGSTSCNSSSSLTKEMCMNQNIFIKTEVKELDSIKTVSSMLEYEVIGEFRQYEKQHTNSNVI